MFPILRITLCLVVFILTSCTKTIAVERANGSAICKNSCQQRLITCSKSCYNSCQECNQTSNQSTSKNYKKYKHEKSIQGGIIARDLNSYRDPLQCTKISCDCLADYNVCAASCNGIIHKRLQIAPVCCE